MENGQSNEKKIVVIILNSSNLSLIGLCNPLSADAAPDSLAALFCLQFMLGCRRI